MLTTPLEVVNLNGTLRRDCSIFYNDLSLTYEDDDDEKLLEEIYLLSTLSSPGSHSIQLLRHRGFVINIVQSGEQTSPPGCPLLPFLLTLSFHPSVGVAN